MREIFKAKVRYLGILKSMLNLEEEVIELGTSKATVSDLLDEIIRRHGEDFRDQLLSDDGFLSPRIMLHVNGELVRGSDVKRKIIESGAKAEILVLPSVAGG